MNTAMLFFAIIGAVSAQNAFALIGNIRGHAEHDWEAFGSAEHGVCDAGVAAGGIEQNFSAGQCAGLLGGGYDAGGGAVFYRSTGVGPLGLTENLDSRQMGGQSFQTH